jgi:hypothetical protein
VCMCVCMYVCIYIYICVCVSLFFVGGKYMNCKIRETRVALT